MENTGNRAIAIVGVGAVLPEAPNAPAFWKNIKEGRYCITEVTPDRWDPALYYDPDPAAPDKTYSKIGGWVREHAWDPMKWRLPIPPRVANAMDTAQQWAIGCTREALEDYGYPKRAIDTDRTAVILGNAMAGEKHYLTSMRVYFPEYARELGSSAAFAKLPESVRQQITEELHSRIAKLLPEVTEDSMPGELANCIAGRIANLYNFHGPNFVCDAACASAMAAMTAAVEGLVQHHFDYAIAGGIDRNMGAPTFVKFCKIGALSATGSRPYADGADGFVMGEGTVIFLLRRLADAERDGDKIYAVIRGIAGSSDGKGKGITAPNPVGQKLAVERAWENAGLSPATATYIEGHGTSTKVGDVVEVESIASVLSKSNVPAHTVALGSVKSNIGHLKGAAGAAGLLKTAMALHEKVLPPSLKFERPNPNIDFAHCPLYVNTELREWKVPADTPRRAGASAFGFGGTNFHVVLEEFMPGRINGNGKRSTTVNVPAALASEAPMNANPAPAPQASDNGSYSHSKPSFKAPLRGALVIGAATAQELSERLSKIQKDAAAGHAPDPAPPAECDLHAPERVVIDYGDSAELADRAAKAIKALAANQPAVWKALRAQGVFRGTGPAPKVAFLYTGQGSQYVNMLRKLRKVEPIVAETFAEADRVMTPILGKPLTEYIYVDKADPAAVAQAEEDLRQTAITQPAVLATDASMTRLLAAYGIEPDMAMGHSLGEYGALEASGALPFEDALEAVAARGREMTRVSMADNGKMAAVLAPMKEIERIISEVDGYVVIANINSENQAVIGGATNAVEKAIEKLQTAGYTAIPLPVSHAFHTSIVSPASEPLREMLERLRLQPPRIPVVANVDGNFYPTDGDVRSKMLDILARQVAAPVQFVKGLQSLYAAGARIFVETGPKKALHGFVEDVLGKEGDVFSFFTNHPKLDDVVAFNQALCGLYAAGLGRGSASSEETVKPEIADRATPTTVCETAEPVEADVAPVSMSPVQVPSVATTPPDGERYIELGRMFAEVLERGYHLYKGDSSPKLAPVVVSGAAIGLPGTDRVFDDTNVERILRGDQFIKPLPIQFRQAMLDKHIMRLVKTDNGGPTFEAISDINEVIKLAGRGGDINLESEYGVSSERVSALDRTTVLAIASGMDALRDAGIPLVMRYKKTTKGTQLPDRWGLPDALRDDTGVIFASAFPGYNAFADEMARYYEDRSRRDQLATLERIRSEIKPELAKEIEGQIAKLRTAIDEQPYVLDRRFLFRTLPMGHSQFAEHIGARGPNTQINAACASTAQAIALAEDWIYAKRCRRVIVVSADDVTTENLMQWMGAGFLASGAAATDEVVEDAATPFDRRRHGMIVGMGAAAIVIESAEAARERGIRPICEVLGSVTANSAFHGTRLDVQHISNVMESTITQAEKRGGIRREEIASRMVFVSHETYTPARGGSASAEIFALRRVFGERANQIVIANTKGLTGHAMGTGMEDVVAIKALETGHVPPVVNFKEVDPELGELNLSKGGKYPVEYALHLGAGFGSQISMNLLRWVKSKDASRQEPNALGYAYRIQDATTWNDWLARIAGYPAAELEVVNRTLRVRDRAVTRVTTQPRPEPVQTVIAQPPSPSQEPVRVMAAVAGASAASAAAPVMQPVEKTTPVPVSNVATQVQQREIASPVPVSATNPAATALDRDVKGRVLALVAEKTGYPIDMLDLDLDLEADLGVDTVKQAEVFATIREAYGIARDDTTKLREFPTLAHVIRFVYDRRPDLSGQEVPEKVSRAADEPSAKPEPAPAAETQEAPAVTASVTAAATTGTDVKERVLALVVEKTGYPKEMLDLDLDLEADLGVDTVKQAEMFAAIRELYAIPRDETVRLRDFPTLSHVIKFVHDRRPDLTAVTTPAGNVAVPETPVEQVAAPVSQAAVVTQPSMQTTPPVSDESIKEAVLDIVAEKTGYPKDMLDLDLDLEADLGVDTVKQAEVFASVRAAFDIPRDENLKLRDFPTLNHVIKFAAERRAGVALQNDVAAVVEAVPPASSSTAVEEPPAPPALSSPPAAVSDDEVKEKILDIVAEKTGYPKDMLDLDLDLEADLGVDTVKQAEVFASVRAAFNIARDENLKLRDFPTLNHVIKFACDRRASKPAEPANASTIGATPAEPAPAEISTAATPVTATQHAATVTDDEVKEKVLDLVAEKTGYPKDMLDLDLDLEADLGVDTVKQAEVFASVRALFAIPRDESLKLRDFPTLAHVIRFACERRAGAQPTLSHGSNVATPAVEASPIEASPRPGGPKLVTRTRELRSYDAADSIPRRVPVPVLRPPLNFCKQTGVKLGPGTRVVIMPDENGVAAALTEALQQMGVEVIAIDRTLDPTKVADVAKSWLSTGPIHGVYWLPALDVEDAVSAMDISAWHEAVRLRLTLLYAFMRNLYEQIATPGTFLVSATRLGGQHGYDPAGATAPMGGAVVGFTKTYKRERPEALVKAVDFTTECDVSAVTQHLMNETLHDNAAVEIGYKDELRWTVGLQEKSAADGQPGLVLDESSVFVVTGAAGSIVSAITTDLASASGGTFYLLDLVPEPDPNNPDIQRFIRDKDGLKRDLFKRIQERGQRATPALVEKELAALERAHAALTAINAVRDAGGTPHYFSVNLTDTAAVARIIDTVRERSGHIDVLLHAAGLERSHFLPDKDPREFDLVFDVKADGWFNLLHAIGNMPLAAMVAFSSIAGRFGNAGQADYSSANDLLCKFASSFRTTRPSTRGIVIDWTAWGGIGMATRGSIPKMMELAGIDMLPPDAGIPIIRRELTTGSTRGEIVIGQRLGVMLNEWDPQGGIDPGSFTQTQFGPMTGSVISMGIHNGLTVETTLDPKQQPFLYDHQIDGTPVLPGVMGMEAFAEIACCMIPGWRVEALEDVNLMAPFKFYRNEPRTLTLAATFEPDGENIVANCRLIGERKLPNHAEAQVTTHFTARVRLTKKVPKESSRSSHVEVPSVAVSDAGDIYKIYFHGPAYQVLRRGWRDGHRVIAEMAGTLPSNHLPPDKPTTISPRTIELCLQTAGLWEIAVEGRFGLPHKIEWIRFVRNIEEAAGTSLYCIATPDPEAGSFDTEVVDASGNVYLEMQGYRTATLPTTVDNTGLKALQVAAAD